MRKEERLPMNEPSPRPNDRQGALRCFAHDLDDAFEDHPDPAPVFAFFDDVFAIEKILFVGDIHIIDQWAFDDGDRIGIYGRG
jgi:hypothetical protein